MKVLYMSGYAGEILAQEGLLEAGLDFIPKPFTVAGISRKVREVLDRGRK
jgi:DNA-binding response OmpR family regulator